VSPVWDTLNLPSPGETALNSALVVAMGAAFRFWVFLADYFTDDPKKIEGLGQFAAFGYREEYVAFLAGPFRKAFRWIAFRIVKPLSWVMILGGTLFLLLSAIEAIFN
jgi:hypothetical protein